MRKWVDELLPILQEMLQDGTSLSKREIALWTLGQVVESTGCVVEPYRKYPQLLDILLNFLKTEEALSIRREARFCWKTLWICVQFNGCIVRNLTSANSPLQVVRVLGLLGALDPYKHKIFLGQIDSAISSGAVLSQSESELKLDADGQGGTQSEICFSVDFTFRANAPPVLCGHVAAQHNAKNGTFPIICFCCCSTLCVWIPQRTTVVSMTSRLVTCCAACCLRAHMWAGRKDKVRRAFVGWKKCWLIFQVNWTRCWWTWVWPPLWKNSTLRLPWPFWCALSRNQILRSITPWSCKQLPSSSKAWDSSAYRTCHKWCHLSSLSSATRLQLSKKYVTSHANFFSFLPSFLPCSPCVRNGSLKLWNVLFLLVPLQTARIHRLNCSATRQEISGRHIWFDKGEDPNNSSSFVYHVKFLLFFLLCSELSIFPTGKLEHRSPGPGDNYLVARVGCQGDRNGFQDLSSSSHSESVKSSRQHCRKTCDRKGKKKKKKNRKKKAISPFVFHV